MASPLTTDDPIAERRFAYAQAAARDGDFVTAAEVLEQALEIDPGWAGAWFALGEARQRMGNFEAAGAAFGEALRLDPPDHQGAGLRLAALQGVAVEALPRAYVARLFDDYAPRFEAHLTGDLGYRGPAVLLEAVQRLSAGRRFARALDLGCGSGLAGAAFRPLVDRLVGVDLSPGMLDEARRAGHYDALVVADVVEFLASEPAGNADLIIAADVFVYLGDIAPTLKAARAALSREGWLAFTTEAEPGDSFGLGETLRFRHSSPYLGRTLADAGLKTLSVQPTSTRREAGTDVQGWLIVATRVGEE